MDKYATTSRSSPGESNTLMVGIALTGPKPAASFALGCTKLSSKPRRSYRVATPSSDGPACPPPPAIAWQRKHCDAEFAAEELFYDDMSRRFMCEACSFDCSEKDDGKTRDLFELSGV